MTGFSIDLSKPITSLGDERRSAALDLKPRDGKAYVVGDKAIPLSRRTVWDTLKRTAEKFGARDAAIFVEHGVRWSWSDLVTKCDALAAGLLALGLQKGDRIGIWSPNRPEWLLAQFASARLGLILVNINPAYRVAELEFALNKVGCKALILASSFKSSDYIAQLRSIAPEIDESEPGRLDSARLPRLKIVIRIGADKTQGMLNFDEVMAIGGPAHRLRLDDLTRGLDPDEPINIQFTSGTTGSPKGATLTHANIVNNARFVTGTMAFTENDRLCIPVPLYHCFGMVMGTLGCATKGAAMIFPGEGFEAGSALQAIARERCTAVYGVPTMFVAMLDHQDFAGLDLSSLRTGVMAGAPCPIEVMKKVVSLMHAREITIGYGMTETSPVSFQSHIDDPIDKRVSTVGRVHPHVEVKIITADGRTARVAEPGELCTRGYSVMRGYWDDDAKTREAIDPGGWMHTGDLAVIDAEGYCNIVGRVKDMLIRGGENVYPREIEEFLFRHPKIKEVQVFGVPDEKYGEEVCAWVVLKPGHTATEDEIRDFCKGQIAHYKVPRYVRFKETLPMTITGKPQKFIMRDAMIGELGLKKAEDGMKLLETDVLLVIDVQNDFIPGGRLAVTAGHEVVPIINELAERFRHVVLTQDWHPEKHSSFASSHPGKESFAQIEMHYGQQTLWPDHCVQGSEGAEFHDELDIPRAELILRKGHRPDIDSYSAFFENDRKTPTGLNGYLRERGFQRVFCVGLAFDYCVRYSAEDAFKLGFDSVVIESATRAIDLNGSAEATRHAFRRGGISLVPHLGE